MVLEFLQQKERFINGCGSTVNSMNDKIFDLGVKSQIIYYIIFWKAPFQAKNEMIGPYSNQSNKIFLLHSESTTLPVSSVSLSL